MVSQGREVRAPANAATLDQDHTSYFRQSEPDRRKGEWYNSSSVSHLAVEQQRGCEFDGLVDSASPLAIVLLLCPMSPAFL